MAVRRGDAIYIEDPPNPPLDEVQQREPLPDPVPPVSVTVVGPVPVRILPSRVGPAFKVNIDVAANMQPQQVLHNDLKRAAATLISDQDWFYMRQSSGEQVPWPKAVPLVVGHCDAMYALAQTTAGTISVITEIYAD